MLRHALSILSYICGLVFLFLQEGAGQSGNIYLEGSARVGMTSVEEPEAGTIRWNGIDLEGFNGIIWVSLTDNILSTVEDNSGNIYKTLRIGEDTWMIENLRTRRLRDNTTLGDIISPTGWAGTTFEAVCRYDNSDGNLIPYGYLYNGYAVEDERLCPTGWHVSTVEEWERLMDLFGGAAISGGPLKESGFVHWFEPNSAGTNESGFGAVPGGNRKPDGTYVGLQQYGNYWAIDLLGLPLKDYNFEYDNIDVTQLTITDRRWGLSVRCVKDR